MPFPIRVVKKSNVYITNPTLNSTAIITPPNSLTYNHILHYEYRREDEEKLTTESIIDDHVDKASDSKGNEYQTRLQMRYAEIILVTLMTLAQVEAWGDPIF